MKKYILIIVGVLTIFIATTLPSTAKATVTTQEDVLEHGKYIASIAGCIGCHTPYKAEFLIDPSQLSLEQIQTIAFDEGLALDESKLLAGGRAFPLGPAGIVFTRNLTPDVETGLGGWTDEQIKVAVRTGQTPAGTMLFPIMPYHNFNGMADEDLNAVVAYIRSVKAVNNPVPPSSVSTEGLQPLPFRQGIVAPDGSDKGARGKYLVEVVMGCTDCHTPINPENGAPRMDLYLGGGQPYEGPWGIVYGGNITPHNETGIGEWTEAEIKRAIVSGVSRDGRRLILMPWPSYTALTDEDADAVVYYMKNILQPVENEVPAASVVSDFVVQSTATENASSGSLPDIGVLAVVGGALVALAVLIAVFRKKGE